MLRSVSLVAPTNCEMAIESAFFSKPHVLSITNKITLYSAAVSSARIRAWSTSLLISLWPPSRCGFVEESFFHGFIMLPFSHACPWGARRWFPVRLVRSIYPGVLFSNNGKISSKTCWQRASSPELSLMIVAFSNRPVNESNSMSSPVKAFPPHRSRKQTTPHLRHDILGHRFPFSPKVHRRFCQPRTLQCAASVRSR